jgi:hypothetical protein
VETGLSTEIIRERDPMTQPNQKAETHETKQSLWLLVASPTIWSAHFLACYITAAIWCAKYAGPDSTLGTVRVMIAVYTVISLIGIWVIGLAGYRRHTFRHTTGPHDFDTPESRHRFLGFATLLLSALSAVATVFVALAAVFIEKCY